MRIAVEQRDALNHAMVERFDRRMVQHTARFAPELYRVRGPEVMLVVARMARERGTAYGFETEGALQLMLELMLVLGCDFDSDPQLRRVCAPLHSGADEGETRRAQRLYNSVHDYLDAVAGRRNERVIAALRWARQTSWEDFRLRAATDFGTQVRSLLQGGYPEKAAYIGDAGLDEVAQHGHAWGVHVGVTDVQTMTLLAVLAFALGWGIGRDPLYPWVRGTLDDPQLQARGQRGERLYQRTMTYLQATLANFGEE